MAHKNIYNGTEQAESLQKHQPQSDDISQPIAESEEI